MKRTYVINGIDCANCAMKLEDKINKIKGVSEATINFMMAKLIIETQSQSEEDFEEIMKKVKEIVKKMEPDAVIEE